MFDSWLMDMLGPNTKLTATVEAYFAHLRSIRATGGATGSAVQRLLTGEPESS